MEYQGFTGSNYEEDDLERAKRGGSIGGFGRNTLPPGYEQGIQMDQGADQIDNNVKSALMSGILNAKSDETENEYKKLDEIKDKMIMRQRILDSLMGQQLDSKQQQELNSLQEQQATDEDMYKLDPLYEEHQKRRAVEDARMPDAPPSFGRLNKLIR